MEIIITLAKRSHNTLIFVSVYLSRVILQSTEVCLSNCRLPRSVSGGGGGIGGDRATFIGNTKVTTINLGLQYVF